MKSLTGSKSSESAVSPATDTVTSVDALRTDPFSVPVTVTVVAPAASETICGASDSVTSVDALASSVSVNVAGDTVRPETFVVPLTDSVSAPSATSSSAGSSVNCAVPVSERSGIVNSNGVTGSKSAAVAVAPVTDNRITVTSGR